MFLKITAELLTKLSCPSESPVLPEGRFVPGAARNHFRDMIFFISDAILAIALSGLILPVIAL